MTTFINAADQRAKINFVQQYPLPTFFGLAFALTWLFLIADALGSWGLIPFRLPLSSPGILLTLLMAYCPTLAAVIVTGLTAGRAGLRKLFGRILRWRAGVHWYLLVIFGVGLLYFMALQLHILLGGAAKPLPSDRVPVIAIGVLVMFPVNGLVNGEEFGWRGFALPRLLAKYNALTSSLLLGCVWILFHLPLFFTKGGGAGGNMSETPFIAFALIILSGSVLVTWLFNNTRGSVLFAYLFHAASNTWPGIFASAAPDGTIFWTQAALLTAAAVIVVIVYGPARLSRIPEEEWRSVIDD
jgi:membrane protease YdiL (CAAX protease family)